MGSWRLSRIEEELERIDLSLKDGSEVDFSPSKALTSTPKSTSVSCDTTYVSKTSDDADAYQIVIRPAYGKKRPSSASSVSSRSRKNDKINDVVKYITSKYDAPKKSVRFGDVECRPSSQATPTVNDPVSLDNQTTPPRGQTAVFSNDPVSVGGHTTPPRGRTTMHDFVSTSGQTTPTKCQTTPPCSPSKQYDLNFEPDQNTIGSSPSNHACALPFSVDGPPPIAGHQPTSTCSSLMNGVSSTSPNHQNTQNGSPLKSSHHASNLFRYPVTNSDLAQSRKSTPICSPNDSDSSSCRQSTPVCSSNESNLLSSGQTTPTVTEHHSIPPTRLPTKDMSPVYAKVDKNKTVDAIQPSVEFEEKNTRQGIETNENGLRCSGDGLRRSVEELGRTGLGNTENCPSDRSSSNDQRQSRMNLAHKFLFSSRMKRSKSVNDGSLGKSPSAISCPTSPVLNVDQRPILFQPVAQQSANMSSVGHRSMHNLSQSNGTGPVPDVSMYGIEESSRMISNALSLQQQQLLANNILMPPSCPLLSMEEINMVELFYRSHKSQVFVSRCQANLFFGSARRNSASSTKVPSSVSDAAHNWTFHKTGIPLFILDSGDGRRHRKLQIVLAERGTGFILWVNGVDCLTNYSTDNNNTCFHVMHFSNDHGKLAGIYFDDSSVAEEFSQNISQIISDPNDSLLRLSSSKSGKESKMERRIKSIQKRVKSKPVRKSDISLPCCFSHVTNLTRDEGLKVIGSSSPSQNSSFGRSVTDSCLPGQNSNNDDVIDDVFV